ncbi:hypothetical protein HQ945_05430 [Phyllobacterium sp. BT25]|uniref:Chromosomal replication initiator DnaA C-terminal domain-containing protein n=1 Tax=Phyllobacterium pellucidum TaxID=2740464 RepID=A0A849VLD2_9HYPH|nr:helix-turn-helix domain-containing protein [Phyllobacterium pellucidum]NTS30688.1 hypothetical protein [Phyllobacterium pellucidum]
MLDETAEQILDRRYRGMNPKFVKQVWEKRRRQETAEHRRVARDAAELAKQQSQRATTLRLAREWEVAQQEELFRAQFLENIGQLRLSHLVEKYKSAAAIVGAMEVRYRAAEIIQHHVRRSPFSYSEVMSDARARAVVAVRQAAMADIHVLCPHFSLTQIGKLFGGRDHTTVLHALKKMGVWRGNREQPEA